MNKGKSLRKLINLPGSKIEFEYNGTKSCNKANLYLNGCEVLSSPNLNLFKIEYNKLIVELVSIQNDLLDEKD